MRKNYWNAITIALGACAMPHLIAQVNIDPSRPIASAVLSGSPNPATYGKIGNLNWEVTVRPSRMVEGPNGIDWEAR